MFASEVAEVRIGLVQHQFARVDEEASTGHDLGPRWPTGALPSASKRIGHGVPTNPGPSSRWEANTASELGAITGSYAFRESGETVGHSIVFGIGIAPSPEPPVAGQAVDEDDCPLLLARSGGRRIRSGRRRARGFHVLGRSLVRARQWRDARWR